MKYGLIFFWSFLEHDDPPIFSIPLLGKRYQDMSLAEFCLIACRVGGSKKSGDRRVPKKIKKIKNILQLNISSTKKSRRKSITGNVQKVFHKTSTKSDFFLPKVWGSVIKMYPPFASRPMYNCQGGGKCRQRSGAPSDPSPSRTLETRREVSGPLPKLLIC